MQQILNKFPEYKKDFINGMENNHYNVINGK